MTKEEQFEALGPLYTEWNAKINVISRKDIDNLYEHHIKHSLAIAEWADALAANGGAQIFAPGNWLVDVGCGGGFPGIPLAIRYPECHFLLVDRIGKKVRVAQEVAQAIGLTNVEFRHASIEEVKETFDYAVSRAVMPLPDLVKLVRRCVKGGLVTLKGGDLTEELRPRQCQGTKVTKVSDFYKEEFFVDKVITFTAFK